MSRIPLRVRRAAAAVLPAAALILLTLIACARPSSAGSGTEAEGDSIEFRHARHITMVERAGYTLVELADPWKAGHVLHRYALVPKDAPLPAEAEAYTVVRTPLSRAILFTTVHCALVAELERKGSVAGVADLKYVKQEWVQRGVADGRIVDCGNGMEPDIERIIDTNPDALLLSPFEHSGGYGKLEQTGVPIVECADYMEEGALARAEWMRFYGRLFGAGERADSLFSAVEHHYLELTRLAAKTNGKERPRVLMDKVTGSVWYVPGGRSTMAELIRDAGGDYIFADDTHSGSVPLAFETVLDRAQEADVWLLRTQGDTDLARERSGYTAFRAYQTGQVWMCDVEHSRFYEETPFHPDRLLSEFYNIFSQPQPHTRYFLQNGRR